MSSPGSRTGAFRTSKAFGRETLALGARVRTERQRQGWTLEELAARMDGDFRQLHRIEAGQTNPTLATLLRLAQALDVGLATLVGGAQPQGASKRSGRRQNPAERDEVEVRRHDLKDTIKDVDTQAPDSPLLLRLASNLRAVRTARGLSQGALAQLIGLAKQHVQRIEAGRQNVTVRTLDQLATALEISAAELLDAPSPAPRRR